MLAFGLNRAYALSQGFFHPKRHFAGIHSVLSSLSAALLRRGTFACSQIPRPAVFPIHTLSRQTLVPVPSRGSRIFLVQIVREHSVWCDAIEHFCLCVPCTACPASTRTACVITQSCGIIPTVLSSPGERMVLSACTRNSLFHSSWMFFKRLITIHRYALLLHGLPPLRCVARGLIIDIECVRRAHLHLRASLHLRHLMRWYLFLERISVLVPCHPRSFPQHQRVLACPLMEPEFVFSRHLLSAWAQRLPHPRQLSAALAARRPACSFRLPRQ